MKIIATRFESGRVIDALGNGAHIIADNDPNSEYAGFGFTAGFDRTYDGVFYKEWGRLYFDSNSNGIYEGADVYDSTIGYGGEGIDQQYGIWLSLEYTADRGNDVLIATWNRSVDTWTFDGLDGLGRFEIFSDIIFDTSNEDDSYVGSTNDDTIYGFDGNDKFLGRTGNDFINGGNGNDTLYGNSGDDNLNGGPGIDQLYGGSGSDTLIGGDGSDTAFYSTSSAAVHINLLSSTFSGGDAEGDTLTSIENITGSDYADTIIGNSQNNSLNGGSGNDIINGWTGNDTLYGGDGSNTYTGGSGDDFAVFNFARSSTTSISSTSVTTTTQTETLSGIEGKAFLEVNHGGSFVAGQAGFQDIDGDGKTDLILQNNSLQFWTTSGSSSGLVSTQLGFEHGGTSGFTRKQMQFADINGDGYSDAIWQGNDNQFWSNFGSSSGFGGSSLVNTHGGTFDPDKVQYVDATGNGAQDLIFHGNDNRFWLSKSNGTNFDNPIHAATHGGPTNFASVQYADVDGDGKKDLIYHGVDNRFWISKSNGTTFGDAYFANQHGGGFDTTKVQYADFDGDGKDDMFYQGDDNRIWVAKSNGTTFVGNTLATSVTHDDFNTDQVNFFDMNGDNKADMVYQGDGNEVWYYDSNGSNFATAEQIADFSGSFTEGTLGLGDINGDGSGDLFYQDSNNDFFIALNSDFM